MAYALRWIFALGGGLAIDAVTAQDPSGRANTGASAAPTFAAPVRLQAGDKFMGEGRLYPSPVFHDVDGDGRLDVVIGDLPGRLTVALRVPGEGPPRFAAEKPMLGADGQPLKFHNW